MVSTDEQQYLNVLVFARPDINTQLSSEFHPFAKRPVRIITSVPAFSGNDAFALMEQMGPKVVIVDSGVTGFDGHAFIELRRQSKRPVVLVGLADAGTAEYEAMGQLGLDALYPLPLNGMIFERMCSELPSLYENVAASWNKGAWNTVAPEELRNVLAKGGGGSWQRAVIAIWSPKGGVGKSAIAQELAVTLAAIGGRSVALVDANMNGGHIRIRLNIQGEKNLLTAATYYSMAQDNPAMRGDLYRNFDECMTTIKGTDNLVVLPGITSLEQARHPAVVGDKGVAFMRELLSYLRRKYDFVIVDMGSSINVGIHMGVFYEANQIIVVATPDLTSLADAKIGVHQSVIPALGLDLNVFSIVVNQWRDNLGVDINDVAQFTQMPIKGIIPNNMGGDITRAGNEGRSFVAAYASASDNSPDIEKTLTGFVQLAGVFYPPIATVWNERGKRFTGGKGKGFSLFGKK
jgi:ATPases involved in chromosome partitioning